MFVSCVSVFFRRNLRTLGASKGSMLNTQGIFLSGILNVFRSAKVILYFLALDANVAMNCHCQIRNDQ